MEGIRQLESKLKLVLELIRLNFDRLKSNLEIENEIWNGKKVGE